MGWGTPRRAATVIAAALLCTGGFLGASVALGASAAQASDEDTSGESIQSYDVTMTLQADDSMQVVEKITYDFGSHKRHGITRDIPIVFSYDKDHDRKYPISDIKASSPDAPADLSEDIDRQASLRIGDPDNGNITGVKHYTISYTLEGIVNNFEDHQELYWNAIGDEWGVPIAKATALVKGPAAITKAACFRGQQGTTDTCTSKIAANGEVRFDSAGQLPANSGMTVVTSFPSGTFGAAAPILIDRWNPAKAFELSPLSGAGSLAGFALIGGGALWLVSRKGRDERYLGVTPGLEPGFQQDVQVARSSWRRDPVAVQFAPPKDMRPGELGTLIDEHANVVDVTASIIDLAVRGYLRIEEVSQEGWFKSGDWRLVQIRPFPPGPLADYEVQLLNALFVNRDQVLLSELKQTFRSDLGKVQSMLYDEVTRRGWFRGNPASVRNRWLVLAVLALVASIIATVVLAGLTHYGLIGIALVIGSIVLLACAPRMPARTARGTALLAQAKGFELYLTKAEGDEIRWQEQKDIFSRYLPYAIVFGVAERWAGIFDGLARSGADIDIPSWYVGYMYGSAFNYATFGQSMQNFATTTSGSLSAPTPSSSGGSGFGGGGFAGGGGGGGGGGSW